MGIRSYLGLASNSGSSQSGSTTTRTGGQSSSGPWFGSDRTASLPEREIHPEPAATDNRGRRLLSPRPAPGTSRDRLGR
ncbi:MULTISPECIES: hypothetical protein [unclassified Kitasatospora]|uniref:hypothetical protein n=1 Tax=unclassified Kitasatospora TaxID=2633591 RepID=UPI00070F2777|nr:MULTISPECIES: hypothetical protein [unclassified Kitasatospora]KQV05620.1 hypothetical protein ASC99_12505 [Kitasatospora sp. Root107]KRB62423.1 hypothetical protein ASE03_07455 [Kitasatospora sp. Root187]